jgi:Protein of unknown function (DUF1120)
VKKQLISITVLSSLIFGINTANASAPTAELSVIGTLTVPGCTVIAPDSGIYDFGRVSSSLVKSGTTTTPLPPITKTWRVNCDANTYLSFTPEDNRLGSAGTFGSSNFGLGNVNSTGKIGHYTAKMHNATVDGVASDVASNSGVAASTNLSRGGPHSWWLTSTNSQNIGKIFTADITVSPVLAGTTTMGGPIHDDVNLDGSMTMGFKFGI